MQTAGQLLETKGREVHAIGPDEPVYEAIRRMAELGIGALLVMEGTRLLGVVSERDYARKVILRDRSSRTTPVRDIMSSPVITVRPEATVSECMQLMTERRIRHLPVVAEDRVVGVLSIGDLVKAVIADQRAEIEQLTRYIAS
ncbi:MAG: CBS domain-containing protein [Xanthomonadales bacterium]|nr:CBS domain-containing protein [Xanthomonadales bacterium]